MEAPGRSSSDSPLSTPYQYPAESRPSDKDVKEPLTEPLSIDSPQSGIAHVESLSREGPKHTACHSEDGGQSSSTEINQRTGKATQETSTHTGTGLQPHGIHWMSLVWTMASFVLGLAACVGHHEFYSHLDGIVAGDSNQQEWNLRLGSILALAVKLFLRSTVWLAYTQFLWKTLKKHEISISGLDAALSAPDCFRSLLNWDMIRVLKLGFGLALIAWCLEIPQLITPVTLSVISSTITTYNMTGVPSLNITDPNQSHIFAEWRAANATTPDANPNSYTFSGPKSILTRLSSATGALGEILPISAPSNSSSYSITFSGPYVDCLAANSSVISAMNTFLIAMNNTLWTSSSGRQYENITYAAFVPSPDLSDSESVTIPYNGTRISALYQPKLQEQPKNASNEIWLYYYSYSNDPTGSFILDANQTNIKYLEPTYSVCSLYNATFDLTFSFEDGVQTITINSMKLNQPIPYPSNDPYVETDLVQLSYSAVFWTFSDLLVGIMALIYDANNGNNTVDYSSIASMIERTSLLGSNDLDMFFDDNSQVNSTYTSEYPLSAQRVLDKDLAQNQTLPFLIQQLSFNLTVSLLNNLLLGTPIQTNVSSISAVNRYSYNARNLWLAYGLANLGTVFSICIGMWAIKENRTTHDNSPTTLLSLSRNHDLDHIFPVCSRGRSPQTSETMREPVKIVTEENDSFVLKPMNKRKQSSCTQCARKASQWRDSFKLANPEV